jgi:hypothetical protein
MVAYVYNCIYQSGTEVRWEEIGSIPLSDTVTGEQARLRSTVKICRTDSYIHVRFECADDHIVATYENRDDPIYKEDAVEIFIDESGKGRFYKEFELSPRNVVFDALIDKEEGQTQKVDASWNLDGLLTQVTWPEEGKAVYDLALPIAAFDTSPAPGMTWRINFYRIDEDPAGQRHYWAWSPTGARRNFHVPAKFGTLVFE